MISIIETDLDFTTSNPASVSVPVGSEIVAARLVSEGTDAVFKLWLQVDPAETAVYTRAFSLVDTGQSVTEVKKYIGTFLMGTIYKHVFEV